MMGQVYRFVYENVKGGNGLDRITPVPETRPAEEASTR